VGVWFVCSYFDYSLLIYGKDDMFISELVYMDYVMFATNDPQASKELKAYLDAHFSIKNFRPLKHFLVIDVALRLQAKFLY